VDNPASQTHLTTEDSPPRPGKHQGADRPGIMASLPRRQFITEEASDVTHPMMPVADFSVITLRVLVRLWFWFFAGVSFITGNLWDSLRGKGTEARQAARLRRILERYGGTFLKIGQFMAMRIDLLPWTYCVELSNIIDQVEPFPVEYTLERVERATRQPIEGTFDLFDPKPIVSSTIACVYQGVLKGGQKVAVKVGRPGFGDRFMTDIKALEWILRGFEFFSILRPGYHEHLVRYLRETIQDELNFTLEARSQSLFRSEAKKSGKNFFNSPKSYFDLCSSDVIVEEFTSGLWLWELIAAVEHKDQVILSRAKQLNIDPRLVAKRLLWVNFWGLDEHLLFQANLSPDNVIVRKNSKLTFIDFSSVGALSQEKREATQQTMQYAWKRDPLEMAHASMVLLEPLPPIDTIKFIKDLEAAYWKFLYALESKQIEWWERTSALMWLGFVRVAREHIVTMDIHVLRMIRACLFYDTIAARLSPKIDRVQEYHKFHKYRAKMARKRINKRFQRQIQRGIDDRIFLQIEEITDTSERLFRQFQRFLSTPIIKFNAVLNKSVYAFSIFFRLFWQLTILTTIILAIVYGFGWIFDRQTLTFFDTLTITASNRIYQLAILFLLIVNIRTILFRLGDKEV
jgi:predicted unusual protein kinase regulating ubiquinone biosynthesis (AarF/ABC1/UbiB family)